jgi:tetratricopeptide (TPR) repeat protein
MLTGDLSGATDALLRAQQLLQRVPDKEAFQLFKGAEAFLQIHNGRFQAAYETYRTLSCEKWTLKAAAMTNRACCLEHLGKIREAQVIQGRAYRIASKAGHFVGEVLCLANLGIFNAKVGNLKDAHGKFEQIKKIVRESGSAAGISFKGVESEEALLAFLEGNYQDAVQLLHAAIANPALLKRRQLECRILECEVLFEMSAEIKTADVDKIAAEGAWSPSPLYAVQLALLRSRTIPSVPDAIEVLDIALIKAREFSFLYEECRTTPLRRGHPDCQEERISATAFESPPFERAKRTPQQGAESLSAAEF